MAGLSLVRGTISPLRSSIYEGRQTMSTVLKDKKYTIEDYMKLDDDNRYELIDGELILVPRPRSRHQKIAGEFFAEIKYYLKHNAIGEVLYELDVFLGEKVKVVAPDVIFIAKERLDIIKELNIQGAPDLVIEVLSPSTARHDRKIKRQLYFIQ